MTQVAEINVYEYAQVGPLVLYCGIPMVEGSIAVADCDYYWPDHPRNEDGRYEVIAFNYHSKRNDHYIVIFRDKNLNPVERLDIKLLENVPWDVPFNIRTGERVDRVSIGARKENA